MALNLRETPLQVRGPHFLVVAESLQNLHGWLLLAVSGFNRVSLPER